jgi:transposase-like protein
MRRLSEAQKEQILRMNKDGKTPREIQGFLKETYGIDVTTGGISYTIKASGNKPVRAVGRKAPKQPAVIDRGGG